MICYHNNVRLSTNTKRGVGATSGLQSSKEGPIRKQKAGEENQMKKEKTINLINENAVTLAAVHTHTHTYNLLKKIKRMNI